MITYLFIALIVFAWVMYDDLSIAHNSTRPLLGLRHTLHNVGFAVLWLPLLLWLLWAVLVQRRTIL